MLYLLFPFFRKNRRPRQDVLPHAVTMVNYVANGIPEFRNVLPFVYQPWRRPFQQLRYLGLGNSDDFHSAIRTGFIRKFGRKLAMPLSTPANGIAFRLHKKHLCASQDKAQTFKRHCTGSSNLPNKGIANLTWVSKIPSLGLKIPLGRSQKSLIWVSKNSPLPGPGPADFSLLLRQAELANQNISHSRLCPVQS